MSFFQDKPYRKVTIPLVILFAIVAAGAKWYEHLKFLELEKARADLEAVAKAIEMKHSSSR